MGVDNLRINELLNLDNEEKVLEKILEANDEHKQRLAVYNNQLETSISQIKSILENDEEYSNYIDVDKLTDRDYVEGLLNKLTIQFEKDKAEFNQSLQRAKEVLDL